METKTTKTKTGIEISLATKAAHEDFIGIVEAQGGKYSVLVGRRDMNGYFHPSYAYQSRSYKSIDRAVSFASTAIVERLNNSRENRGTLCADDIIR